MWLSYLVKDEKVKNVRHSTNANQYPQGLGEVPKLDYGFASGLCVPLYWLLASVVKKFNHGDTERTKIHGV
jgi:hypothetical protein